MNAKLNPINSAKLTLGVTAVTLSVLAMSFKPFATTEYTPTTKSSPADQYVVGVQSIEITSKSTGIAVIKLDDFRVQVSFDYSAHKDSYGVPGSEFTAVDINQLTIENTTDINGKQYRDFTVYNDVVQIKELIRGYIEKNQLVEVEAV